MPSTVASVNAVIESLWPLSGTEPWDSPGLISGDAESPVGRIHLAVDATIDTVDEAISSGADLLLVHHPLLLRGVTTVASTTYKGTALARLIRAECALVAAHTNADVVETGTSATLATLLGLVETRPLVEGDRAGRGLGRVGRLEAPTTLGTLARRLADVLPPTASGIRVAGEFDREIETVALCGGAGDSLLGNPHVLASDVYITSDLRHHPASEFRENARTNGGPALIDISHWASEWLWLTNAAQELRAALPDIDIAISDIRTDPWDFVVMQ